MTFFNRQTSLTPPEIKETHQICDNQTQHCPDQPVNFYLRPSQTPPNRQIDNVASDQIFLRNQKWLAAKFSLLDLFLSFPQIIFNVCLSASTDQDSVDSCIDITSPTPSQSRSESSSSRGEETKKLSEQRPVPLGCSASGSSEEEGEKEKRLLC